MASLSCAQSTTEHLCCPAAAQPACPCDDLRVASSSLLSWSFQSASTQCQLSAPGSLLLLATGSPEELPVPESHSSPWVLFTHPKPHKAPYLTNTLVPAPQTEPQVHCTLSSLGLPGLLPHTGHFLQNAGGSDLQIALWLLPGGPGQDTGCG